MSPWDELADAHQQLADAQRHGDALAAASAEHRVRLITDAIGWRFASGLFAASRSEDVRGYVGRLLDRFELTDDYARGLAEDLAGCVGWLTEELLGHRHAITDLRREVERLRRELETVRHEREERERSEAGADGAGGPEAVRPDERFPRVVGW